MSISHAEFLHSLKPLGRYYPYRLDDAAQHIQMNCNSGQIEILLGEERRKPLGSLVLPETRVEFRFHGCEVQAIERFFSRFDLCFRRGGG